MHQNNFTIILLISFFNDYFALKLLYHSAIFCWYKNVIIIESDIAVSKAEFGIKLTHHSKEL